MQTVTFDGVEFTKATQVAKQFGYTADYLGQLCRAKKVNARLVGRSWFINVPSLEAHRENRYQGTEKKNSVEIPVTGDQNNKRESFVKKSDTTSKKYLRRVPPPEAPLRRVIQKQDDSGRTRHVSFKYEADDHSLIPKVPESPKVRLVKVEMADAATIDVTSVAEASKKLTPGELPDIALSGKLAVSEIPDEVYENKPQPEPKEPEEPDEKESSKRDNLLNKVKISILGSESDTPETPADFQNEPEEHAELQKGESAETEPRKLTIKQSSDSGVKKRTSMGIKRPKSNKKALKKPKTTEGAPKDVSAKAEPKSHHREIPLTSAPSQLQIIPIRVAAPVLAVVCGIVFGTLLLSAEQVLVISPEASTSGIEFVWSNIKNLALVLFTG